MPLLAPILAHPTRGSRQFGSSGQLASIGEGPRGVSALELVCGCLDEGNADVERQLVVLLLPQVLSRQFRQPETVCRQPPVIEVGYAKQQSLPRGRLHVPGRKRCRRQVEPPRTQSDVHV